MQTGISTGTVLNRGVRFDADHANILVRAGPVCASLLRMIVLDACPERPVIFAFYKARHALARHFIQDFMSIRQVNSIR